MSAELDEETPCCTFCGDEDAPYRDHNFGLTTVNVCRGCAVAAGIALTAPNHHTVASLTDPRD